ncbi:helix-turn-helix domain-containing protein [Variovorax sp. N23]|uniref:helix-turn-helix domain-containing protein n=1 Tax=Variovorax sp. N23 TaxID=2980555 RepID=UPI0021C978FA|nr:helix-turn-helix transcriptional regulator [Variovorax sp. N23]MCU4120364.1 helix-turn-helix domain-containing protein [Variovorax sp. N23]
MLVKSSTMTLKIEITNMKVKQSDALSAPLAEQCTQIGELLARLRHARKMKQSDAAVRAGLSRNTAYRLEQGDPGVAFGQILRYLQAIAPGATLVSLLTEADPALVVLRAREATQRVRDLTAEELKNLDF